MHVLLAGALAALAVLGPGPRAEAQPELSPRGDAGGEGGEGASSAGDGRATDVAPAGSPPPPGAYDPPAVDPDAWVLRPRPEQDLLRVFAQLGGGLLGAGLGGGLGVLVILAVEAVAGDERGRFIAGAVAGVLGAVGLGLGVELGARATESDGRTGDAVLGQLLASLLAAPLVVLALREELWGLAAAVASVIPLVGGVVANEISHASRQLGAPVGGGVAVLPLPRGGLATYLQAF